MCKNHEHTYIYIYIYMCVCMNTHSPQLQSLIVHFDRTSRCCVVAVFEHEVHFRFGSRCRKTCAWTKPNRGVDICSR